LEYWTQQILNGLTLAAVLFLLASGLSLIYGLMRVLNLAHGSFYLVGAFIGLAVMNRTGNFLVGAVVAVVAVAAMGALVQRFLIARVQDKPSAQVLLTFGLVLIAADIALWIGDGRVRVLPKPAAFDGPIDLGIATYPKYRLLVIGVSVVVAFGSWLLQDHTRLGAILRAAVDDQEMASGVGTNVPSLFTWVFALGAGLGALAGVMAGPFFGIFQGVDLEMLILAFVVVVVGGTGSLVGAIVGSLAIGLVDTFGKVWFPSLANVTVFLPMAVILVMRPAGLFGRV
jgi:branched-chain amino acid transport system permease protein